MSFCGKSQSCIIQNSLNRQFSILGGIIARRPLLFLTVPIVVSIILSTGFFWMEINRDFDWLYTDPNGRAARNKRLVETLFPFNTSIYNDHARITSVTNATIVLIIPKDGGSILREEIIQEAVIIDNVLREIEVQWKGRMANYSILCGKIFGKCIDAGLAEFVSNFQKIKEGKYKIKYPLLVDNVTFYYKEYISLLGGVKLDNNGYVKDIKALRIAYQFDLSDHSKHKAVDKWEEVVYNYFVNTDYKYIELSFINRQSSYKSAEVLATKIVELMPFVSGTILLFSVLTCMTDKFVTSKPFLGISTCFSAGLAIASGFGFGFFLGIQYQDSCSLVMYAVLAIEVDDGFMLIASWRNTNHNDSVPKRMQKIYYHTATSITITSITNILACSVGMATTSVPAFRMLCAMAASCSFFAYVYQLTFFGACLAFSGYYEERNTCSIVCSSRRDGILKTNRSNKNKGDIFMLFYKNTIGQLLSFPTIKVILIVAFIANLGTSLWGWKYLMYGIGMDDFYPANTYTSKFVKMNYKYFAQYTRPVHVIIKDILNYADPKIQSSIDTLAKQLESHPHIADSSYRISWLTYYKNSTQSHFANMIYYGYNISDKQDFLDGLRHVFLRNRNAIQFNSDIAFNENYTEIVASRFLFLMKDINSTDTEITTIKELYEIASKSDLPVEIFGVTFHLLEQAWIVKNMAIQIASLSVGLSCLIFFIFSQNIRSSLCVAFIVMCVICEMVGYFSLWGVGIDLASLTIFTVSVGFSINYPSHMAFAFAGNTDLDPEERVKDALYRIGFPTTQGALSTILGLSLLLFQQLYVVNITFKVLCLIALLSLFHSLFVIPIILHLFGLPRKHVVKEDVSRSFPPLFDNKMEAAGNNMEVTSL